MYSNSKSTLSKQKSLLCSCFCRVLLFLLLPQLSVFSVNAQSGTNARRFSIYSSIIRDSIRLQHRFTSDSTSEFSLQTVENSWLKTSLIFQNEVLWQGAAVDFRTYSDATGLWIEYTFLGNKILGYNFCLRKRNGRFEFYKKTEFQELPNDRRNVCNLRTRQVLKDSVRVIDNGVLIGRCIVK